MRVHSRGDRLAASAAISMVLATVLLSPSALASVDVHGVLTAGSIDFAGSGSGTGGLEALLAESGRELALRGNATIANACLWEESYAQTPGPSGTEIQGPATPDCRTLTGSSFTATSTGQRIQWVGAYCSDAIFQSSHLTGFVPNATVTLASTGWRESSTSDASDNTAEFRKTTSGSAIEAVASEAVLVSGDCTLKATGVLVVIQSDSGQLTWQTGANSQQAGGVVTGTLRWVTIQSAQLVASVSSSSPILAAVPGAKVAWRGSATIGHPGGTLDLADGVLVPRANQETMSGAFSADLVPAMATNGVPTMKMNVGGTLDSSTMVWMPRQPAPPAIAGVDLRVLVGLGVIAGGGAAALLLRKRIRSAKQAEVASVPLPPPESSPARPMAGDLREVEILAMVQGRWGEALSARRSRDSASPPDIAHYLDTAFYLL